MLKKISIAIPLMMVPAVVFGADSVVIEKTMQELRDSVHGIVSSKVENQRLILNVIAVPFINYDDMAEYACGIVIKHDLYDWEYIEIRDATPETDGSSKVVGKFDCLLKE